MNDTTTTPTTAARAAAEWWAKQVAGPTFDAQSPGHFDFNTAVAGGLASLIADRHPVTTEQLANFTDLLETAVTEKVGTHPYGLFGLHTDYGPERILGEAADAAGISTTRFPWKTSMWLRSDGALTASCGYGAPERVVWAPPGWVAPDCGQIRHERHYDDEGRYDFVYFSEICGRPKYHDGDCGDFKPDALGCGKCGKTQADHYNGSYKDFGHSFDYGEVAPNA